MVGSRQSLFPQTGSRRTRRPTGSAVNSDVQRNLMIFIASSFIAGMLVGTASAQSPCETGNDTKATLEAEGDTVSDVPASHDLNSLKQDHPSYLADYAYSEVPPDKKPADIVLDSLKDIPTGTPIQEIKRASDAFGLDFNFMRAIAKIESGFDPKQRTGSYIG